MATSPTSLTTPTSLATQMVNQTPPASPTLADFLARGLGKRKREVTHIEGIPVAVVECGNGSSGEHERQVRTPRRRSLEVEVKTIATTVKIVEVTHAEDAESDDEDDITILV